VSGDLVDIFNPANKFCTFLDPDNSPVLT